MFNKGKKERITYGIIGLGRFGSALASELAESGADLIVIDEEEEKIRQFREYTDGAFVVKNLDKKSLEEAGVQDCDIAVVCIGEQLDMSILTTLHLVSLGVPHVIAKAKSIEHGEILEKLGAEVVYPEKDMAIRLAHRLEASRNLDYIQLSEKLNISKLVAPDCVIGKSVLELNLRKRFGVNVIAIENGKNLIKNVFPEYVFKKDDVLFISGDRESLNSFSKWEG